MPGRRRHPMPLRASCPRRDNSRYPRFRLPDRILSRVSGCSLTTLRFVYPPGGRRVCLQMFQRTSRPAHQFPATIGTDPVEDIGTTLTAKCAFKCTDESIFGIRWKVPITTFTVRTKFEHGLFPSMWTIDRFSRQQHFEANGTATGPAAKTLYFPCLFSRLQ